MASPAWPDLHGIIQGCGEAGQARETEIGAKTEEADPGGLKPGAGSEG